MFAYVEARRVPLPKRAAVIATLLARFLLLGMLNMGALVFLRAIAVVFVIFKTVIVAKVGQFILLPFICAAAAGVTSMASMVTLAASTHVWPACVTWHFINLITQTANGEGHSLTFCGWLLVAQDLFQKAVDVELDGDTSLFNIANAR